MLDMTRITEAAIYTIPALAAAILTFLNGRQQRDNHKETKQMMADIQETTNGKMDRLLSVTGTSEHAKGVLEESERNASKKD